MSNCPDNYESLEEWCSELEEMNDKLIAANRELQEENEMLKDICETCGVDYSKPTKLSTEGTEWEEAQDE